MERSITLRLHSFVVVAVVGLLLSLYAQGNKIQILEQQAANTMAFLMLLFVLSCCCWQPTQAKITGFYADPSSAMACDYPMAEVEMDQLECFYSYTNRAAYSMTAWKNSRDGMAQGEVCYWGQDLLLGGKVTVSEGVYRYFEANVNLCFSSTFCYKVKTKVDLMAYKSDYDEQEDQENQDKSSSAFRYMTWGETMCSRDQAASENTYYTTLYRGNCLDFLPAGEYEFSVPLVLPKITFAKSTDTYEGMTANITMYPRQSYQYNDDEDAVDNYYANSRTVCAASFQLFEPYTYTYEEDEYDEYYAEQAAAAIFFVGVLGALVVKRRNLTTCTTNCAGETVDDIDDNNDLKQEDGAVSSNFEKM